MNKDIYSSQFNEAMTLQSQSIPLGNRTSDAAQLLITNWSRCSDCCDGSRFGQNEPCLQLEHTAPNSKLDDETEDVRK